MTKYWPEILFLMFATVLVAALFPHYLGLFIASFIIAVLYRWYWGKWW